jgi:hypothetical protein
MDLFGRRNIEDANLLLTMQPWDKLKLLAWYHVFRLEDINDVPYNVNMTAYAGMVSGDALSRDLGKELDLVALIPITPRMDVLFGYSHFFTGDFYTTTPVALPYTGDADFYYTQMQLNF